MYSSSGAAMLQMSCKPWHKWHARFGAQGKKGKGIYILSSHAGPMQDARRLKPKRPKPANCKQEN